MKILVFSDIHGDWKALEKLMSIEADYYIAAGDLSSWRRGLEQAGQILARRGKKVYVLPGNHETEQDVEAVCARHGLNPFHGRVIEAGGYYLAGLGYSGPTPFHTPGEYTEAELSQRLAAFGGLKPLILICHTPPKDTPLDEIRPGHHAGSVAVREFIERERPEYFFCGHIHEAHGRQARLGSTRAWNTGREGVLLELDERKAGGSSQTTVK